jgi:endoglucanase
VTWAYHFIGSSNQGDSPDWSLNSTWLDRVSQVVDMITDRGLYAIINTHHDTALWIDVTAAGANYSMIEEKFYRLWYQVGLKLACKPSLLAFEPMNEPAATTDEHFAELHNLNNIFLKAINDAGGFNPQRVVTLVGPGEDIISTSLHFERPDPIYGNPYALQVHYYSPCRFLPSVYL